VDDITLSASSTSLQKNIRTLEKDAAKLVQLGAKMAIKFNIEKTELIHFTTSKEAIHATLKLPNGQTIHPAKKVKWLGIHLDSGLTFKEHIATRASQARSAFQRLSRLANIERGLTPFAIQQLYTACVISVADYGCQVY
jgi:hypothetical protein